MASAANYLYLKGINAFSGMKFPFESSDFNNRYSYNNPGCPKAQATLDKTVIIPIGEYYSDDDVKDICLALDKINEFYGRK